MGGIVNSTARSRYGPTMRSRHSRNAAGSPASASSTALRVNASPSPASNSRAARLTWSRQPRGRPAGLPRPPLGKPPAPVPRPLFSLFYLIEIRHRQLLQSQSCTRSRVPMPTKIQCDYGNHMIVYLSNPAESNGRQVCHARSFMFSGQVAMRIGTRRFLSTGEMIAELKVENRLLR
jgi:hypothetical protein